MRHQQTVASIFTSHRSPPPRITLIPTTQKAELPELSGVARHPLGRQRVARQPLIVRRKVGVWDSFA